MGPHPDDVELGCVAALFEIVKSNDKLLYVTISYCLDIERNKNIKEELKKSQDYLKSTLPCEVSFQNFNFPNRKMFEKHMEIRDSLEKIRAEFKPDIVFTTSPKDLHQDHRYIGEEVMRVFRECTLITYEIPRSVGIFIPNMYVSLSQETIDKVLNIKKLYKSQSEKKYMSEDLVIGTLKHRGGEVGQNFAQAFEVVRIVLKSNNNFL
ncbi:MAG: PIG-L deacetylase family protein [Candidatus Helarchaeota archaeon]